MLIDPSAISSLLGLAVSSFKIHNLKEIFLNPLCQISYSLILYIPGQQRHFYLKQIILYYTVFRCFPLLPLSPVKYKLRLFLFTLRHLQLINVTLTKCWPQIKSGSTELHFSTKCRGHTSDIATRENSGSSNLTSLASESPTPFITR